MRTSEYLLLMVGSYQEERRVQVVTFWVYVTMKMHPEDGGSMTF
jgi:hypothetical protein